MSVGPEVLSTVTPPRLTWEWDVVGGRWLVFTFNENVPDPRWWRRLITRVVPGSRWKKLS